MPGQIDQPYKLHTGDIPKASKILADAFQYDPIWKQFIERVPSAKKQLALYELTLRHCIKFGYAYASSVDMKGIAGWLPGELADMTLWRLLRSGALIPGIKIGARVAMRMKSSLDILERDRKACMHDKSYIYLQILGVATEFQGQGYGGKLLRSLIQKCDEDGQVVYLETGTERNVNFYKKFGFVVINMMTLPDIHLPMWEMVREPV